MNVILEVDWQCLILNLVEKHDNRIYVRSFILIFLLRSFCRMNAVTSWYKKGKVEVNQILRLSDQIMQQTDSFLSQANEDLIIYSCYLHTDTQRLSWSSSLINSYEAQTSFSRIQQMFKPILRY